MGRNHGFGMILKVSGNNDGQLLPISYHQSDPVAGKAVGQ